jgi:acyl-CoA thioesterase FadM
MYLTEAAVLEAFREWGFPPARLYEDFGLALQVVDSSVLLTALLLLDERVQGRVSLQRPGQFLVELLVQRGDQTVALAKARVWVEVVGEAGAPQSASVPAGLMALAPLQRGAIDGDAGEDEACVGAEPFTWEWVARYFHCQYSDRVQYSAYVRALEETVDRYLAACGMSVAKVLGERNWIPVVSRLRLRSCGEARMEEIMQTTFRVKEFIKRAAFVGTMECRVERAGNRVRVAAAEIMHGYAWSSGAQAGKLVDLDEGVQEALGRRGTR